jgi:dolichyl-diphosphooligosaccharide--protein glycosyltransferase
MKSETILNFLKKHWYVILLILIFLFALSIRLAPARYGELQALDPFYFFRVGEQLLENNFVLPEIDVVREYPIGIGWDFPMPLFLPPAIFTLLTSLGFSMQFLHFAIVWPAIMGALAVLVMFFLGKELFGVKAGLFAALFLATIPAFITRTSAGFYEKEPISGLFIVLSAYFFIRSYKRKSWISGILAGISLAVVSAAWGGVQQIYIFYALFVAILLLLNHGIPRLMKSYVPIAIIGIALPSILLRQLSITSIAFLLSMGVLILLIIRYSAQRFKLVKSEQLKFLIPVLIIITTVGLLIGSMFNDDIYRILDAGLTLATTQVISPIGYTVAENAPGDLNSLMGVSGSQHANGLIHTLAPITSYFSIWTFLVLGIVILLYGIIRNMNFLLIFPLVWIVSGMWSVFYAIRLMFLFSFPAALLGGFFAAWLVNNAYRVKTINDPKNMMYISGAISLVFFLLAAITYANIYTTSTFLAIALILALITYLINKHESEHTLLKRIYNFFARKHEPARIDFMIIPITIFVILAVAINMANGYVYSNGLGPSICFPNPEILIDGQRCTEFDENGNLILAKGQPWYDAMTYLAENREDTSNILSWWDFGYWFQTRGKMNTVADGGWGPRKEIALWYTADTDKWEDFDPWLRDKYGVDYILMDYTLPGKYGAISAIATDGQGTVGIMQFTNAGTYQQDNTTIYEFASGQFRVWVPVQGTAVSGPATLFQVQNEQYGNPVYINDLCTESGILTLGDKQPAVGGCVTLTQLGLFFVPEEAKKTIFTNLMFMNGFGLPVETIFDNTLIKIYKVIY